MDGYELQASTDCVALSYARDISPDIGYLAEISHGFYQLFQANTGNISNWATTTSFPGHSPSSNLPTLLTDSPRFTQTVVFREAQCKLTLTQAGIVQPDGHQNV
jgi:hypothetical protein